MPGQRKNSASGVKSTRSWERMRKMSRSKTKSVSLDGIKHACEPGYIETRACKDAAQRQYKVKGLDKHDAISLEVAYCTAFLSRNEALQMAVSIAHAGARQWGEEFVNDVTRLLEGLRGS